MAKKGQAALEYLMTYGWAILVLVAIVSALFALGVFSPSNFVSEECNFQPDFTCSHFILFLNKTATNTVLQVTFHNGLGYPINITTANFTMGGMTGSLGHFGHAGPIASMPSGEDNNFTVTFSGTPQPSVGSMEKIDTVIVYKNEKTGMNHTISGRITARVEPE